MLTLVRTKSSALSSSLAIIIRFHEDIRPQKRLLFRVPSVKAAIEFDP